MISIVTTPAMRAILASAVTAAALFAIKPISFFDELGRPREARWLARADRATRAAPVPWWLAVAAVGVAVDLFV